MTTKRGKTIIKKKKYFCERKIYGKNDKTNNTFIYSNNVYDWTNAISRAL